MLVQAQMPSAGEATMHAHAQGKHGRMDSAKMQERMAERQAELKAKLQITATQETAWNAYLAAMKPPADHKRMNRDERKKMHEEMKAMTTPQRLDRMAEMKAKRDAHMQQRAQATRTLYDALTPEQQKVFDASTMMGGRHDKGGDHGKRGQRHHG
jgi:Spy/CpxP family protein refolding chaperone